MKLRFNVLLIFIITIAFAIHAFVYVADLSQGALSGEVTAALLGMIIGSAVGFGASLALRIVQADDDPPSPTVPAGVHEKLIDHVLGNKPTIGSAPVTR